MRLGAIAPAVKHGEYDWFESFCHIRAI
jgi:hypothetical protein